MGTWAEYVEPQYREMLERAADAAIADDAPQYVECGKDFYCVFSDHWVRVRGQEPDDSWPRLTAPDGTVIYVFLAPKPVYGQSKGDPTMSNVTRWRLVDGKIRVYKRR